MTIYTFPCIIFAVLSQQYCRESQARKEARRINAFPERAVVKIWQDLRDRNDLVTEEGEPIKIIYPGRLNGGQGADWLDAVIATSQGLRKGDIEVHVRSSRWWAHRHHRDPVYNRVILHVVMWRDTEAAAMLQNGERVATLVLDKYLKSPADRHPASAHPLANSSMPCHQPRDSGSIGEVLDSAGKERFLAKAARFQVDLAQTEAGQSLYQGIMGALGYAKNKSPFLELARRLPLQALESVTQGERSAEERLARQQALLLGTAGLLPSQSRRGQPANNGDEWRDKLERLWASSGQTEAMSENDWQMSKVRPNNLPSRRIAAMSYLLLRYREKGILEALVNELRGTPVNTGHHGLARVLRVTTNGYWASHFDLLLPSRLSIPTLLGERRAADIVVNVLLPFTFAWGRQTSQPGLARKSLTLYRRHPRLGVNAVERHMSHQLGLNSDLVDSAQRQQGLIHIYQTLCSQGKCQRCPIAGADISQT